MAANGSLYTRLDYTEKFAPKNDLSDNIVTPPLDLLQPAKWLPIAYETLSNGPNGRGTSPWVIAKFKPVALERAGDFGLVPAGISKQLQGTAKGDTVLSYTAADVTWKTENLVTGLPVSAAVSYTNTQVADALLSRGLVTAEMAVEYGAFSTELPSVRGIASLSAAGVDAGEQVTTILAIIASFFSVPVGVAPQAFYPYLGKAENNDMKFKNWNPQNKVNFLTRAIAQAPHVVATVATREISGYATTTTLAGSAASADQLAVGEWINATNMAKVTKFSAAGVTAASTLVFLRLSTSRLANHTSRTPFSTSSGSLFLRQRTSLALVTKSGDFYIDEQAGGIVFNSVGWTAMIALAAAPTITYYEYKTLNATTATEVLVVGDIRPGDRLTYDADSNFIKATSTTPASEILGVVYTLQKWPRGGLERVTTGWHDSDFPARHKMPGSASDGYTDIITMASETAADEVVIFLVEVRP